MAIVTALAGCCRLRRMSAAAPTTAKPAPTACDQPRRRGLAVIYMAGREQGARPSLHWLVVARIADLLGSGPTFSFEFFPPKTDEEQARLETTIKDLEPLHPSFVSVTYRGGRSSRERTTAVVLDILRTTAITAMPHLVCVAHSREELTEIVDNFNGESVENLLALGGDPVADEPPGELRHALELVELARARGSACIGVDAHPAVAPPRQRPPPPGCQARGGRLRDHPILLPRRGVPAPAGGAGRPRHPQAGDPWDHAGDQPQVDHPDGGAFRLPAARRCRRPAQPGRGRPEGAPAGGHRACRRALPRPARRGRARAAFLHPQLLLGDQRDLSLARAPRRRLVTVWQGSRSPRALAVAYGVPIVLSIILGVGSATRLLPFDRLEAFGFISGAWGVWLQVRENVWNWPIQLVSSALYVVVFFQAGLYSDASLNVLYIVLYLLGWYWWLRGGERRRELRIGRLTMRMRSE